ncbi:hypothetical protein FGE12_25495 [Aggregicoccus sp. 17bor-14]|uniref:hypothetical protein n=1 Tax=Myxococcaceae TaxID=31 RepID=UPI00129CEF42|nr:MULTISPECIES: hypothetical protein [Myxococcaceae]MBF5045788.1 hypothetical protein [Simulacricoccus sp. 17bor-14]MRI91523.1 hypothetical protein [Aggregicoccus sp. 17bor-14]
MSTSLALSLLVLAGLLLLLRFGRRLLLRVAARALGRAVGKAGLDRTPATLTLEPGGEAALAADAKAVRWTQELRAEGFVDAGAHTAHEMPGVALRLLTHPAEGFLGVVYVHPRAGSWCDVVVRAEDGSTTTCVNRAPTGLNPRPGHPRVNRPGASAHELVQAARESLAPALRRPYAPDTAARDIMDAYAQELAWRRGRGVSAEEVARVAAARGTRRR